MMPVVAEYRTVVDAHTYNFEARQNLFLCINAKATIVMAAAYFI
jgi:hypothetical protein